MQFSLVAAAVVAVLAPIVAAQSNPIAYPDATVPLVAGEITTIKWTPSTEGQVELKLKKGPSGNLDDVFSITVDQGNTGTYNWKVPADLPAGENYAISITGTDDYVNYTPLLCIESDVEEVKTTSSASATSAASTKSASTASDEDETKTKTASEEDETKTKTASEEDETKTKTASEEETETASATETKAPVSTVVSFSYGANGTAIGTKTLTGSPTGSHNSTATNSANVTASLPKPTNANEDEADSSAMAVVRSPLALVACLIGAVVYLG